MKIKIGDITIDTKTDWGYKSDSAFILSLLAQRDMMENVLSNIVKLYTFPKDLDLKIRTAFDRSNF